MKRVLAKNAKEYIGQQIKLEGWQYKKRMLGGLTFINIRDRSGLVQILVENKKELEKLRGLQNGTVLSIMGSVIEEKRAPGGVEIHNPKIEIIVPVTETPAIEIDKPIDHKPDNLDTLFEHRVLNIRNVQEQKIFKIRSDIINITRQFLLNQDFIEIQTPKLIAGATEGGAEVFKLDYFGQEATLAQSPQLYKQIMVGAFERVFEIGPAYRAEPSMTTRHVSELTMLDVEMGFIESHDDVLILAQDMLVNVLRNIYKQDAELLKSLNAPELKIKDSFPRFSVEQVHELYSKETGENTVGEKDLRPDEERWICEYTKKNDSCEAVFITDFPKEAMKFYHKINPDNPKTVLWADLLYRGLEIATIPQRENDYYTLIKQMKEAGLDPAHPGYKYYLQAFRAGLPPHGGFGFGIDRFVEKIIGLNNVKEAMLFPRDINRLTP